MLDLHRNDGSVRTAQCAARRRARRIRTVAIAALIFGPACSLILSGETVPCTTDGDCAKLTGSRCDTTKGECVSGTAGATNPDGGGGDTGVDGDVWTGDPCLNPHKPIVEFRGDVKENLTLTCGKDYRLIGRVVVVPPFAVTIAAGTTIYADTAIDAVTGSPGTLVIPPGARIVAAGEKDKPIVFTSGKLIASPPEQPLAGDWGGVFVFGEAPVNLESPDGGPPHGKKNGLGPWGEFGGNKPANDSGRLEYVRIEYAGGKLPSGGDGISLSLGGVGDQTTIDHLQTRFSGDDCVEVVGGAVNIKHFLCQYPQDDGIAWENGWTGFAQFVVVQARPGIDDNANGFQGRSGGGPTSSKPVSRPTIYNATLCGQNVFPNQASKSKQQYAVRLNEFSEARIFNSIFMGWQAAIDFRDDYVAGSVVGGFIQIKNSVAFGNLMSGAGQNIAYLENDSVGDDKNPAWNDDNGFDEIAFFKSAANANSEANPGLPGCFSAKDPKFAPTSALGRPPVDGGPSAKTPENNGFFDTGANYIGAFRDGTDDWATGRWVVWDDK